jgi:hopanoid-associated phosphorylase
VTASPVIAVTGLKTEARLVAGPRVYAIAGGGDAVGLTRALEAAVAKKASAILSFGVAGGLVPGLAPGSALIARAIISEDGTRYSSDPVWSKRLSGALVGAAIADIAGIDAPLAGHEEKHALHMKTGAHAADMESHIAARIAAAYKLPFAAYRVVADPAHRRLPHAALVALKPDGSLALGAIAESILRDPSQIPQLLRIALDAQHFAGSEPDPAIAADRPRCAGGLCGSIPQPKVACRNLRLHRFPRVFARRAGRRRNRRPL